MREEGEREDGRGEGGETGVREGPEGRKAEGRREMGRDRGLTGVWGGERRQEEGRPRSAEVLGPGEG